MRRTASMLCAIATGACLVVATVPAIAQEKCLRVMTFDWSATLVIDPAHIVNNSDLLLVQATYEPLVVFDNDFQVKPWLAEDFEPSKDGTEWVFKLRKGVKFHDGADLTSADVVYTYKRLIDPKTASPGAAELAMLKPENIRAEGPDKVVFKTERPVAELPLLLATKYAPIIRDGATDESLKKGANGTGPFTLSDFKADAPRVVMKRNESYWTPGKPLSSCLEISGVQDAVTRASAIQSGNVDILIAADATTLPILKSDPNIELLEARGALLMSIVMMVDKPPFDNPDVRRALKLVVDRPQMVELVTLGFGIPGNDNPVPPTSPLAISDKPRPQNIEEAKALLAKAGHKDGLTVDLWTGATDLVPGMLVMVQAYKQMAEKAGIKVNVQTAPSNSFWDDVYLKQPFVTSYWYTRHPVSSMSLAFRKGAKYNETHWYRDDFDQLLDQAATTLDPGKSTEYYKKAQEIIADQGGQILPVFASMVAAVRKGCSGFTPHIESRIMFQDITCK